MPKKIRARAKVLIAYGSCATIGGVNGMKNSFDLDEIRQSVYGKDYKLIFVGDASMSPVELTTAGDINRNVTQESGEVWMRRLLGHYKHSVWLNPEPERYWHLTQTIQMLRDIMEQRMYPLTLAGLDQAMKALSK